MRIPRRSNCSLIAGCCLILHCILNFGAFWDATVHPNFLHCALNILIPLDTFPKRNVDVLGKNDYRNAILGTIMKLSRSKFIFLWFCLWIGLGLANVSFPSRKLVSNCTTAIWYAAPAYICSTYYSELCYTIHIHTIPNNPQQIWCRSCAFFPETDDRGFAKLSLGGGAPTNRSKPLFSLMCCPTPKCSTSIFDVITYVAGIGGAKGPIHFDPLYIYIYIHVDPLYIVLIHGTILENLTFALGKYVNWYSPYVCEKYTQSCKCG